MDNNEIGISLQNLSDFKDEYDKTVEEKVPFNFKITDDNKYGYIKNDDTFVEFGTGGGVDQVQSDYTETNTSAKSYIKNKPLDLVHISNDKETKIISESQMIISPFSLAIDEESGAYGYIKKVEGADTFCPFKSGDTTAILKKHVINETRTENELDYSVRNNDYSFENLPECITYSNRIFTASADCFISLTFTTRNYDTAANSYSQGCVLQNGVTVLYHTVPDKLVNTTVTSSIILYLKSGDTFNTKTPSTAGYPQQILKINEIYLLDSDINFKTLSQQMIANGSSGTINYTYTFDKDVLLHYCMAGDSDSMYLKINGNTVAYNYNSSSIYLIENTTMIHSGDTIQCYGNGSGRNVETMFLEICEYEIAEV